MSRVTGTPGWYWILVIKCSIVILRVSDSYTETVSSSVAKGIHLFQNIGMLCMQELFFVQWVDYLKHCKWSTFLAKGKKIINVEKNENVELPHTQVFCGRLYVLCE